MSGLSLEALPEVNRILTTLRRTVDTDRLTYYTPYSFQSAFHSARTDHGEMARQRLIMAGNKTGKTFSGAAEAAFHATGEYPDWWDGWRYETPTQGWACGTTAPNTRDIVQAELLGDPSDVTAWGTGAIPLRCIGKTERLPGIPNALDSVMVKHISGGWSKIQFKSYEQGKEKFMGQWRHWIWLDEEPPQDIYSQALRASLPVARNPEGGIIFLTMTPENGMTDVVAAFVNSLGPKQALYRATWDDAPHLTQEVQDQILATLLPHEREMRRAGVPVLGSGLVFPIADEQIACEAFPIPTGWPRIAALDFGWDHPSAVVWIAFDPNDATGETGYVYDVHKLAGATPVVHAAAIRSRGAWIPVAWPHDGMTHDKGSGITMAQQYRAQEVNMLPRSFSNPPAPGDKEGANRSVEPGIQAMFMAMQAGKFKVFNHLTEWFIEKAQYHRKDGEIVKKRDDLMAATRYAYQSRRFAAVNTHRRNLAPVALGSEPDWNPYETDARLYEVPEGVSFEEGV